MRPRLLLAGAAVMVAVALLAPRAAAADLSRLHIVLVLDTEDPQVGKSAERDEASLASLFRRGLPTTQQTLKSFKGRDTRADAVLRHVRGLQLQPNEGLLLYFSGHGVTLRDRGHCLAFQQGESLLERTVLRQALMKTGAGLVLLLTDCCSDVCPIEFKSEAFAKVAPAAQARPGFRNLFLQPRGVVDVNASEEGTQAWCDAERGGVFTRAFCELLKEKEDDRALTWKEFYPALKSRTEDTFDQLNRDVVGRGRKALAPKSQTPQVFLLPGVVGLGVDSYKGNGVVVSDVALDSPADQAGFKRGDVLLEIDGQAVRSVKDFTRAMDAAGGMIRVRGRNGAGRDFDRVVQRAPD